MSTIAYIAVWFFILLMMLVMWKSLLTLLDRTLNPAVDTFALDAGLLAQRLVFSPNGLGAVDELTGRPLAGMIDGAKLKNIAALEQALNNVAASQTVAAKITIKASTPVIAHYNKIWYARWAPLVGGQGPGSAVSTTIQMMVLLRENNLAVPAQIEVEVVRLRQ